MRELGERLRHAREAKGLTIEDLTNRTKIGRRYLEALENGDFKVIPGLTYLRGFLQNYAAAVDLDPAMVLSELDAMTGAGEAPADKDGTPGRMAAEGAQSSLDQPRSTVWWRLALVLGAIFLAAIVISISIARRERPGGSSSSGKASNQNRAATGETAPKTAAPAAPAASQTEGTVLKLSYSARCWVRIHCDGKQVFEGTMTEGAVQVWSARHEIRVMLGNSGGVRGELNGKELPPFGATGISVTRVFRTGEEAR